MDADREVLRFQPLIDALSAHVALLDREGTMLAVNAAWKRFSEANGNRQPHHGVGLNYLALLDAMDDQEPRDAKGIDDVETAHRVARGIRAVLANELDKYQIEYPCDSPTESRWFLLTVTPLPHGEVIRAIVSHEDLTALRAAETETLRRTAGLAASFSEAIDAIALAVEKRDPHTVGHQHKVASLCEAIGLELGLSQDRLGGLSLGAKIHDIGYLGIPSEILTKRGRLTDAERRRIQAHPDGGADILAEIDFPWPIADIVRQHHERLDGSGYPRGLIGEAICLEARIVAVADVFEAMCSPRAYRSAHPHRVAIDELLGGRGQRYDRRVVDALVALVGTSHP
ncbi:MAG: HD domain-containing phosphohydrolase [Sandaracinus sp.]